jgi:hypothetical protein
MAGHKKFFFARRIKLRQGGGLHLNCAIALLSVVFAHAAIFLGLAL